VTEPDLLGCADEPIRIPGSVQPHGALLAAREPSYEVVVRSANAGALLGEVAVLTALVDDPAALLEDGPHRIVLQDRPFDVVAHRADGLLVAEWEPAQEAHEAGLGWHRRLPAVLASLQAADDLEHLAHRLADAVRELTGFDRVMVYRFDRDWNGEVVAERRREDLEPFLGLRYPASDIPPQARALYLSSWLRLIPDARYSPVPLQPERVDGRPLDLGGAALRSVSPVHLEYLANMGVRASMSVSLVDGGRLWGLVACHHYAGPHRPSLSDRATAEFLGRTASLLLATKVDRGDAARELETADRAARLAEQLAATPRRPAAALLGGQVRLTGATPDEERVRGLLEGLGDELVVEHALDDDLAATASGVLAVPVPGLGALAWFRPEVLQEVTWGGDPHEKRLVEGDFGPRLSPRRSFAAWTEVVRATAEPWRPHEVAAARSLARALADVTARQAGEQSQLAAALQRTLLLAELPQVDGVALAAHYAPSRAEVVGGDWYDLVLLPGGRVSVVLGDVAGHGVGAASVTAQLRHALRAYLLASPGPAAALERLDALIASLLPEELATAVVAELDPSTGRLLVASAGHLPVLLLTGDGPSLVRGGDRALGMRPGPYQETALHLRAGDRVVLFSDGLVETRDAGVDLDRLVAAAAGLPADPQKLLDVLLLALAPDDADDVTLLALGPA
jgi:two-component system, chemotaxis family, sensor kinase Cph1